MCIRDRMTIEQNIISKISAFPQKKICIIGTMPEKFYILLAKNLMPNDCVCIFDTTGNISKAESSLNNAMYSNTCLLYTSITICK